MFKSDTLSRTNISAIVGAVANDYTGQKSIVPAWKRGMSNVTHSSSSGDYDGAERCIGGHNAYEVDGDLLFTVGWGDGFAVRRINNDGSLTRLFYENNFLWRDTGSTYNHLQSVAIDKVNKVGVVMTYNVEGYTTFDYSGLMDGGTTFVKDPRPTHSTPDAFIGSQDTGGGYVNRVGNSYVGGLVAAGPWFYASDHDAHHYKKVMRRNVHTGVEERLDATSSSVMHPGSAAMDRSGYRGWIFYDEINDRIIYSFYYNAQFTVVLNASTNSPSTVWCDIGDMGHGDDGYEQAFYVPDPVNEPNVLWIGGSTRFNKGDITPCFSGNTPTNLGQVYTNGGNTGVDSNVLTRGGFKYQSAVNGNTTDKMIGKPNFFAITADRGKIMLDGWVDVDNNNLVFLQRYNEITEDTTSLGRGRSYRSDYGTNIFRIYSTNGTPWWVKVGYGADGHSFKIWDDSIANHMFESWSVEYGLFTLSNNANVDFVYWSKKGYYTPSSTTISFFVSNNNGETWESYNSTGNESVHVFSSSGTQLKFKVVASGDISKNAYKMSMEYDSITFGTMYASHKDSSIKTKMSKFKIRGKK